MTKHPEKDDDFGETDRQDVIDDYKNPEGSYREKLAIHNAIRGHFLSKL